MEGAQLRTFLNRARHDRFYALWALEATSGMRRCELAGARRDGLDLDAGTLAIEITRVVINGRVVDVRHSYATAGRDAKIDWKALSVRIGHADVAFTMKQYVQADLEADRQVANTLAELITGGSLASVVIEDQEHDDGQGDAA